jgi:DegV family protein with EDD domain
MMSLLATIDSLDYLRRGGRIGGAAALLGSALKIRPVLSLSDGRVTVFARPRTRSQAVQAMLEQMARQVAGQPIHAAVLHADVPSDAEQLRQQVADRFRCVELLVTELTPVMGAHTGPGVLGVAFFPVDDPGTRS